ncbi:hypothetical protein F2P81_015692 [Scophthalmus maximus]|uniref:Uncharacterized protein n=1 Tax=Scophthalmus maximus TaxID=52904 RepID=A0A6A4SD39_SCOMX|nr:hypothetical protein F2P81_015692 [Scophthalmus maximus]
MPSYSRGTSLSRSSCSPLGTASSGAIWSPLGMRGFLKPQCSLAPPMQRGRSGDACSCFSGVCPLHQRRISTAAELLIRMSPDPSSRSGRSDGKRRATCQPPSSRLAPPMSFRKRAKPGTEG